MHETLVDVETLKHHLADARWRVFDVRHDLLDVTAGPRAYAAGHIPGAQFAHIDDDLSGIKTGRNGRHPLPDRAALAERFRHWGVSDDTQIVAYDAQGGQFAVRLWWLARWLGHRAVALLDGGWPIWLANGGATETAAPMAPPRGAFRVRPSLVAVVDANDVAASLGTSARLLLDARLPERFRGEVEPIDPVAGHIPGARNRAWQNNLNPDLTFKSATALRSEFESLIGARDATTVTHQCGSGVTASHNVFAMELAGLPGAPLYAGSWSEWIVDPAPVVHQPAPAPVTPPISTP
ncbi:MAG: sulfurtransferase, partial [Burkholderiaceae bacterium]